jgi:hypothetical protein
MWIVEFRKGITSVRTPSTVQVKKSGSRTNLNFLYFSTNFRKVCKNLDFPRNNILQFFLFKVSARLSFHVVCKIGLKEKLSFGRWHGKVGLYGRTDGGFFGWKRQF